MRQKELRPNLRKLEQRQRLNSQDTQRLSGTLYGKRYINGIVWQGDRLIFLSYSQFSELRVTVFLIPDGLRVLCNKCYKEIR